MAMKLSTGLSKALLGNIIMGDSSLAFVDGGAGADTITDSENRFLEAGFRVGDTITVANATTSGNNGARVCTGVTAGALSFATGSWSAAEAFGAATTIIANNGGAFKDIFEDGVLYIYSGSPPATADEAETGALLVKITLASGAFVAGVSTNGINFKSISSTSAKSILAKDDDEVWSGVAIATGTAGYGRFYTNRLNTGESVTAIRFDGQCALGGGQFALSTLSITLGVTVTVDECNINMPLG